VDSEGPLRMVGVCCLSGRNALSWAVMARHVRLRPVHRHIRVHRWPAWFGPLPSASRSRKHGAIGAVAAKIDAGETTRLRFEGGVRMMRSERTRWLRDGGAVRTLHSCRGGRGTFRWRRRLWSWPREGAYTKDFGALGSLMPRKTLTHRDFRSRQDWRGLPPISQEMSQNWPATVKTSMQRCAGISVEKFFARQFWAILRTT
jgi:hypothetical protein